MISLFAHALRKANVRALKAKAEAEAANKAKSTFLANMSHELRTPLNAILGFARILDRSDNIHPEDRKQINIIRRAGDHLLEMIDEILNLSRIEAGRVDFGALVAGSDQRGDCRHQDGRSAAERDCF